MTKKLAEINIGLLKAPIDHPSTSEFADNLDRINRIAESSPGFIWRLKDESNNATSFNPYNNELIIINISVWQSAEHLKDFVFRSDHTNFLKRKKEWFEKLDPPYMAMWWIENDHMPDALEGKKRLDHLAAHGPSEYAFDFRTLPKFL